MNDANHLRVAALIDLPRSAKSGGHVKGWERLAAAAAASALPLDLTVYFSGPEMTEVLGPHTKVRQLPPVFSTARLKFLPYVPDHTDLAPYHFRLAHELKNFDVIHTTDGFFAFARTAERISRRYGIPLVTSFHTDTPSYAQLFTRQTIESLFGKKWLGRFLADVLRLPERQGCKMKERLKKHLGACRYALATRVEDCALAASVLGEDRVQLLRLGVDRDMFGPQRRNRAGIESDYNIPPGRFIVLFVGRVDAGKNIYTLIEAMEKLIGEGLPLHLITAGVGPAVEDIENRLGDHATTPGFVPPSDLARLYASVDVFALPSEVEIRSQAGEEALACGCPVLVSEKSGVADLYGRKTVMRTVKSGVDPWTEALWTIATDAALREKMRAAAADYSQNHIVSWGDVLAGDFFAVWKKAANHKAL
ncbi:MAG: glycosyltransferase [Alphaproteobacteria bacterium]|nr:glycosyltransferase [Alphaproteobacteria bacterium]